MLAWIWRLIVGNFHSHSWEEAEEVDVFDSERPKVTYPIGRDYLLRCTKCGDLKNYRVRY